jgi:hypothetical protein
VVFIVVGLSSGMCYKVVFSCASYEVLISVLLVVFLISLAAVCVGDVLVEMSLTALSVLWFRLPGGSALYRVPHYSVYPFVWINAVVLM